MFLNVWWFVLCILFCCILWLENWCWMFLCCGMNVCILRWWLMSYLCYWREMFLMVYLIVCEVRLNWKEVLVILCLFFYLRNLFWYWGWVFSIGELLIFFFFILLSVLGGVCEFFDKLCLDEGCIDRWGIC